MPIERHSASINVTANTTAQQLEQFTNQMGANEKLRGIKNTDGSITLYATDRGASLIDKMKGRAADRSQNARDAISMVMRNVANNNPELLGNVGELTRLANTNTGRSMKTDTLSQMMDVMAESLRGDSPNLDQLPNGDQVKLVLASIANRIDTMINQGQTPDLNDPSFDNDKMLLATRLGAGMNDPLFAQTYPNLAFSDGDRMRESIVAFLQNDIGPMLLGHVPPGSLEGLAETSFDRGVNVVTGNTFIGPNQLSIQGQLYDRGNVLGQGAYGQVVNFVPHNGIGDPVAVKFLTDPGKSVSELRLEAGREHNAHVRAEGGGHPNILSNHGVVRTPDGKMAMILEKATGGNLNDLMQNIKARVVDGTLTPAQANLVRLTLIHDMAQGLNHMHNSGDVSHIDFKPPNVFIGGDGVCKIADFGTTGGGELSMREAFSGIDAPYWQSPEVLVAKENFQPQFANATDRSNNTLGSLSRLFANEVFRGVDVNIMLEPQWATSFSNLNEKAYGHDTYIKQGVDAKAYDSWALGTTVYNLFFEDTFIPGGQNQFMFEDAKAITDWAETGKAPIGNHTGALHQTTGDQRVDDLINKLMRPDPEKRMTLAQVVGHPSMTGGNIGGQEVRDLIVALAGNNHGNIVNALANLP